MGGLSRRYKGSDLVEVLNIESCEVAIPIFENIEEALENVDFDV